MPDLTHNLDAVRQRIAAAARLAGRDPRSVTLLAVSKTFSAEDVRAAYDDGQHAVRRKLRAGSARQDRRTGRSAPGARMAFHRPLQSNKTRPVAQHFDWVHSVDRLKIAQRLSNNGPTGWRR